MMNAGIAKTYDESKSNDCCGAFEKLQTESRQNSVAKERSEIISSISFSIDGMTCMSCVNRIETALFKLPGISRVVVDLSARSAAIRFDPDKVSSETLRSAIEAAGYNVTESMAGVEKTASKIGGSILTRKIWTYPLLIGIVTALGVVGFYLGLLTLNSDWFNARMQFEEYRWWIISLSFGLGIQATLFSHMKKKLSGRNIKAAKSGLATSGGISAASMAACCAHLLVPLLPLLGLSFLSSAVVVIATHQVEIFVLGILSNLFGLGIMLRLMHKNGILKRNLEQSISR